MYNSLSNVCGPTVSYTAPPVTTATTYSRQESFGSTSFSGWQLRMPLNATYLRFIKDDSFEESENTNDRTEQDPSSRSQYRERESVIRFPNKEPVVSHETATGCSVMTYHHERQDMRMRKAVDTDKSQMQRSQCPVCLKTYARPGTLKIHLRIHSGEKPHKCPQCFRAFTQSGNLAVHMRIHTGVKPFACRVCGRRFTQRSSMNNHMKLHKRRELSLSVMDKERTKRV